MKRMACLSLLVFSFFLAGCPDSGPKAPPVAKVSGTVTLDGKPMTGGEVRFNAPGQPAKILEIKDGAFSGEVFEGKNQADVVWEKDGPPHPMDPNTKLKVNVVDARFSGPNTPFKPEVGATGANDLKFEVTSAK